MYIYKTLLIYLQIAVAVVFYSSQVPKNSEFNLKNCLTSYSIYESPMQNNENIDIGLSLS